jgi:hypothetical protein
MSPGDLQTRIFTTYRVRRNVHLNIRGYQTVSFHLHIYGPSLVVEQVPFRIVNERFLAQNPRHVYLVFEVMDDIKPHPRLWVGVSSVGAQLSGSPPRHYSHIQTSSSSPSPCLLVSALRQNNGYCQYING